jgi:Na+-driven multidrug efflux pump
MPASSPVTYRRIFRLWVPLAATWLMMSVEGPFLAAVIARLPEPTFNLAAYGVAFAFALIVEAPIIMILSAATALVRDYETFRKLRNFLYTLNLLITVAMLFVLWQPVFGWLSEDVLALPAPVAALTHRSLAVLLPWPAAIGFRRFYQGLLIRAELTRRVAYGTAVRVVSMSGTALALYYFLELPGALVGATSLSAGVVLESIATRLMALGVPERLRLEPAAAHLSYRRIIDFYIPLALTSVIALAVHPLVTFSLGQSRLALESLAVFPVVTSLTFIFRSMALSYQEVAITLLDGTRENFRRIARFAAALGAAATLGLVLIAFTPLAGIWFRHVSGLPDELAQLCLRPLRLFSLIPFFSVLLAFQRSILVSGGRTRPITVATFVEVLGIVALLVLGIRSLDLIGVVAAVVALFGGRLLGNAYMMFPVYSVLRSTQIYGPR